MKIEELREQLRSAPAPAPIDKEKLAGESHAKALRIRERVLRDHRTKKTRHCDTCGNEYLVEGKAAHVLLYICDKCRPGFKRLGRRPKP